MRDAEDSYDIVVIGAGPSGCVAAMKLARRFNVLVLERCRLPRNKSCSGVLIRKSVNLVEKLVGKIPESVCCTPVRTTGLTIITSARRYDYLDGGLNVVRSSFDNWLAEEASSRGARIVDEAVVTAISAGPAASVTFLKEGARTTVAAKLVIACDGVNGTSRRLLGLGVQEKVVTFQKFYKGSIDADSARFYAYTSPEFSQYDAWFNSKNGMIVAGSIASNRAEAARFQDVFVKHLQVTNKLVIEREIRTEVWSLPLVLPEPDILLTHGSVMFSGEAAGMLNPFGEGMSIGMTASLALAEACLANSDDLDAHCTIAADYRATVSDELAYMKRQWGYLREISPEFCENVTQQRKVQRVCISGA